MGRMAGREDAIEGREYACMSTHAGLLKSKLMKASR